MSKHVSSDNKKLQIYKASAGSGKTYRLTAEYIDLLFSSSFAYKHILAVTFTNKATDEMKSRIVTELAKLAMGKPSGYIRDLAEKHNMPEEKVRAKARQILVEILHDYSAFAVSTIDRFFQQTMRAFTREIGIGGGYNVELDSDKVLSEAIDMLLADLEKDDSKQLLEWLIRFSEEKIENGETWNIRNDIQSLSKEIFKESYKASAQQVQGDISDKELMDSYKHMLHACINSFRSNLQQLAEKALNIIAAHGLTTADFKGGGARSPFNAFVKWANGEIIEPTATFYNLSGNRKNWYASGVGADIKSKIEQAYDEGLNDCVAGVADLFTNSETYQTATEINRYIFTLGILGDIDKKIHDYTSENNIMLISDTTELLNKIIQGSDAPFVYEKTGLRISNYMIDEFQDTSRMQWDNFKPLLKDSLSHGNIDFIVGDVKQSIYRWRNSDWKLLDEQIDYDFRSDEIRHESLDSNWRSAFNIVAFNNLIFSAGAYLLQDFYNSVLPPDGGSLYEAYSSRIVRAYADAYQQVPEKRAADAGHVKMQFVDDKEQDWTEYVLDNLPSQIEKLQDKGYSLKDIAILVRTKKEGALVANRLLEYKNNHPDSRYRYDIISDEALYIQNAGSIKLVLSLLRYIHNPADDSLKTFAVHEYLKNSKGLDPAKAVQEYFSSKDDISGELDNRLKDIAYLPLYEMTEEIFRLFGSNEQVYVQSFLDIVLDYTVRYSSDLDAFLRWWDDAGAAKTIFTPDGQDAIRIMTIHKSKGLGFGVVLIPFCYWGIDHSLPVILWCKPQAAPFNGLHLVPVKYSQKLKNTIFKGDYYEERLHAFIDNFNVLYVAFTRAEKELIIYTRRPKKSGVTDIASLLWDSIGAPFSTRGGRVYINPDNSFDEDEGVFELGKEYLPEKKTKVPLVEEIHVDSFANIPYGDKLQLLLRNKYFFSDMGERDYGVLMHNVVSRIRTVDEMQDAVDDYYLSGDITGEQKEDIIRLLLGYLSEPTVEDWYSGKYRVLNEVQILLPDGKFVRPDRIMISDNDNEVVVVDYKFGQKEDKKHIRQVKYYADQIRKMGYAEVKGFISYITLGKVVEV